MRIEVGREYVRTVVRLTVSLLGPPLINVGGSPIEVDTRKAVALLAYLAVTGEPRNRDGLVGLLWPEYDQSRARAALRRTLSSLRTALRGPWLAVSGDVIGLDRQGLDLDVERFRELLSGTGSHGHDAGGVCPACIEPLTEAVDLHRGDFLAGFSLRDALPFEEWQFFEAEGLRRELRTALERLVRGHEATGDYEPAIAHARRWLALDPLNEEAHRRLMVLYARGGERTAAIRQYRECVLVLDRELGVAPLDETTELCLAIEEDRLPAPDLQPPRETSPTTQTLPAASYPLVGRDEEMAMLRAAYRSVGPDGRLVVIDGEAGIGKTRLAEELVGQARVTGARTVAVRCYAEERGLAYGPFVEALRAAQAIGDWAEGIGDRWLAETGRLVPEVVPHGVATEPLDGPGALSGFYEAVARAFLAALEGPPHGILFLDDLHHADDASLALFGYLARRLSGRPICLLACWRGELVPRGHLLRRVVVDARRSGLGTVITPGRLARSDVAELVRTVTAQAPDNLVERLHEETAGVPFFVVEYLAAVGADAAAEIEWAIPGGVRELVDARIDPVSETGRQVLSAAAVIGRSFDLESVRGASGRSEDETARALEELSGLGLIRESTGQEPTYDFNHPMLRMIIYEETGLARRRLLHRRVAGTLARRIGRGSSASSVVAHHYRAGGEEALAAEFFRRAGEHARTLFANSEALEHFQESLALGHPERASLHEAIGDLHTLRGEYRAARESYEAAAALSSAERLPEIEHKLGGLYQRLGNWEAAEARFRAALDALEASGGDAVRARILVDRSLTAQRAGRDEEAGRLAEEALELAESAEDIEALAQAQNLLGILASRSGDHQRAKAHLQRSLELAADLASPSARVAALNNLALTARASGSLDEAFQLEEEALALCSAQGDRHREAALHNNLADLLHDLGRQDEAMAHLKRAVAIFADIGEEAGGLQPEIWKLVEW